MAFMTGCSNTTKAPVITFQKLRKDTNKVSRHIEARPIASKADRY